MKNLVIFLSLLIGLSACNPVDQVKFEEAQPTSVSSSSSFSILKRGNYINYQYPNMSLQIDKKMITTTMVFHLTVDRYKVEISKSANIDRTNDSALVSYFNQLGGETIINGDSISFSQSIIDTLFQIDENNILKVYKKRYFLNHKMKDSLWQVTKLKFKRDTLWIGKITPSDTLLQYDYTKVDSVNTEPNTKDYILNPSKKEFKKLMRSDAFEVTEKYIKE